MDRNFCDKKCLKGKQMSNELLSKNNSAFDAAIDFVMFTEECFKTCPYKEKHIQDA